MIADTGFSKEGSGTELWQALSIGTIICFQYLHCQYGWLGDQTVTGSESRPQNLLSVPQLSVSKNQGQNCEFRLVD